MDNYLEFARQVVKTVIGTKTEVRGFEWPDAGGLFCKVFKLNTADGNFILKTERDKIFFATRKDQIENEVLGNAIFQKAGIPCANILAYDLTKNNDIKARYIFTECLNPDWLNLDDFDDLTRAEIIRQYKATVEKQRDITNSHFGSLSPSGTLGWHETYDGYYHSTLNLLIRESEELGLFTDEELEAVKKAADKPLVYYKKYTPTFVHGDLALHNCIWGNVHGGENKLYVFDFGNAYYGLPYLEEWICKIHGNDIDILDVMKAKKNLYENNLIGDFERMFWTVTQQLTEDYAYGRMAEWTKEVKKENSRNHIIEFVDKCRKIL